MLESIDFEQADVVSQAADSAQVAIRTVATHTDGVDRCQGTLSLARGGPSGWLIDRAAITCPQSTRGGDGRGEDAGGGAAADAGGAAAAGAAGGAGASGGGKGAKAQRGRIRTTTRGSRQTELRATNRVGAAAGGGEDDD